MANDHSPESAGAAELELLRFITCGSVDDGKSTLIGRLLYEARALFDDQLTALEADSKRWGTQGEGLDFALLLDGLSAEREQGITIDVSYRYFSTPRRRFIVADTPGHEQYTRNMVTGASTADVAVVLVDARKGLLTQTRRHSYLVSLLGVSTVVLAVNKMDLVGWNPQVFDAISGAYLEMAASLGISQVMVVPVSALHGDNVTASSAHTPWYTGPSLLEHLETCRPQVAGVAHMGAAALRLPVQWVNRPHADFRGYSGRLASGRVAPGDEVRVQPSGLTAKVARFVGWEGDLPSAEAGESVTLTLDRELDISRGDVISAASNPMEVADQFECTVVWMAQTPMLPGRSYLLKMGSRTVGANLSAPKHKVNVNTLEHLAAKTLELNDIGVCNLRLDAALPFEPYRASRELGGFILIDRQTSQTLAAGMIHHALRRAHNIHLQPGDVNREARAALKGQKAAVVWLTGLSGSGKSTIANALERRLHAMGRHTFLLDGDNVRHGLNRDLGFTDADRVENIRRVAEVARLMTDAGLIVITAFISPFAAERSAARALCAPGEFIEVFVDAPLALAEARDPKGLYAKARKGLLPRFTGIDSPYEEPQNPDVRVITAQTSVEAACDLLLDALRARGVLFG